MSNTQPINVIFDGPPGPESGRFIEVETDDGHGINVGEWVKRKDGYWALRITELPEAPKVRKGESSNVESIGYDAASRTLEIKIDGKVCQYHGVLKHMFDNLMDAPSKGSFFNRAIAHKFPYSRVADTKLPNEWERGT